jgi:hypothetical protein
MSNANGNPPDPPDPTDLPDPAAPLDPVELASLPAQDPRRARAGESLTGEARAEWLREIALTDRLRDALPDVPVPPELTSRLLKIPDTPPVAPTTPATPTTPLRKPGLFSRPLSWRVAAGLILLAGIAAIYFVMTRRPVQPVRIDAQLAKSLATLAVKQDQAPLDIKSSSEDEVQKTLAQHPLDFPVLLLKPTEGTLTGGGICDFGTTKAAFTRWNVKGQIYTLFEFDGKQLGVPPIFYAQTEFPSDLWTADHHYQVFLFPGTAGKCCWALVMQKEDSPNVFAQYGAPY